MGGIVESLLVGVGRPVAKVGRPVEWVESPFVEVGTVEVVPDQNLPEQCGSSQ